MYNSKLSNICDVKKYEKIYEEIACFDAEDTLQFMLESETERFLLASWRFFTSEKARRGNRKEFVLNYSGRWCKWSCIYTL